MRVIGTCFQEDCQMTNFHYHCPKDDCDFIFEPTSCGGGCGGQCCPAFPMHIHCRLCDNNEPHVHCDRCQRTLYGEYGYLDNVECEHCDLGGNCEKCNEFIPNIKKQTKHQFCVQCNICIDNFADHIHCQTCNVVTNYSNQHYHCQWCTKLNRHIHSRTKHKDDTIQECGVERCTKNYNHLHCTYCQWVNNPGPFQFHRHCSYCDRTDAHRHNRSETLL